MAVVELDEATQENILVLAGSLHKLVNIPLKLFSEEVLSFLTQLSTALLRDSRVKALPDVVSFAYWCRRSNLIRKQQTQEKSPFYKTGLGRGLSFHIAPANIPVNFAFSYVFALLAGNACIVRVPSKPFLQTEVICEVIASILPEHPEIARRTAFVSYPARDDITSQFSFLADVRLIWGGDSTIAQIKALPSPPRCKDVAFSDRYSIAVLNGDVVLSADSSELAKLAGGFYNDTYLMDQNACSSPQMIFWLHASREAKSRFWQAVRDYAAKNYDLLPQVVIDKYVKLCEDIIGGLVEGDTLFDGLLTVVDAKELPLDVCALRGVGGYFYQHDIIGVDDIVPYITERYQTLTYYGCSPKELQDLILGQKLRGIDRVVPIGLAMDIDLVWDGYNLITELSRTISAS